MGSVLWLRVDVKTLTKLFENSPLVIRYGCLLFFFYFSLFLSFFHYKIRLKILLFALEIIIDIKFEMRRNKGCEGRERRRCWKLKNNSPNEFKLFLLKSDVKSSIKFCYEGNARLCIRMWWFFFVPNIVSLKVLFFSVMVCKTSARLSALKRTSIIVFLISF